MEYIEYVVPQWRNLDMRALKVDQCYLLSKSHIAYPTYMYSLSSDCFKCPFERLVELKSDGLETASPLRLAIAHALKFKIYDSDVGQYAFANESALCEIDGGAMREFGVYNLTLHSDNSCTLSTDFEGVNVNWSLLSVLLLLSLICAIIKVACCWRRQGVAAAADVISTSNRSASQPNRLRSLDAFRGFAIVLMIFVNSGGGEYWWMEHATWNGLHVADIVFPCFLWIMGVCIPISVRSQLVRGVSKYRICLRISWRSLKLFMIGLCLNSINGPNFEQLRIMGVLQRFGIAFFVCGLVHVLLSNVHKEEPMLPVQHTMSWKQILYDVSVLRWEFLTILCLTVAHLAILFGIAGPNCARGYLGPGGKHDSALHVNCTGGITGWIDTQILGAAHIYQHPTAKYVYNASAFDPEGIFGCLLTVVQVFIGLLAGVIILKHEKRASRWLTWAAIFGLLGGALCSFSVENGIIPMNKNLWSLSFVFVTSSLAFVLLTLLYCIIDVKHWWSGWPFVEAGVNAIIMYVGHTVMHKMLPWHWRIGAMNTHFVLLIESLWNTFLWIGIALYLDSIKFYYSI